MRHHINEIFEIDNLIFFLLYRQNPKTNLHPLTNVNKFQNLFHMIRAKESQTAKFIAKFQQNNFNIIFFSPFALLYERTAPHRTTLIPVHLFYYKMKYIN